MDIYQPDPTRTQGFEPPERNYIEVYDWECPKCLKRFGERGRQSAKIKVVTARGEDAWCEECYKKGLAKGTCIKFEKKSKKKKRRK